MHDSQETYAVFDGLEIHHVVTDAVAARTWLHAVNRLTHERLRGNQVERCENPVQHTIGGIEVSLSYVIPDLEQIDACASGAVDSAHGLPPDASLLINSPSFCLDFLHVKKSNVAAGDILVRLGEKSAKVIVVQGRSRRAFNEHKYALRLAVAQIERFVS
jgi:hypothetical protein